MADIVDIDVFQTVTSVSFEVEPNTNVININKVTIEGTGGGGATNLGYIATPTNGTVTSSTGNGATIPLADGTNAGLLTPAEKTKIANSVPYTGATSDVNLGEFGIQLGNLEFDNTPTTIPTTAGSVYYNDTDGTLDLILKGGNVTLQVGQETVIRVVNKTSTNISLLESNYQAVRITGAQGQRPKVDLAQATNDVLSAETIGLVTETIANNQEGFITTSGLVRGINTTGSLQGETWLDGDILYLSPTVAGNITKVKPTAPNHLIIIGYVISAHITQGTIFVKVDNGYELDELHNVKIATPANNSVLAYTLATDIWENKTVETALGYTPANDANVVHLTGNETIGGLKTFTSDLTATKYLYSGGSIFPEFSQTFYINANGATHYFGGSATNAQNNVSISNGTLQIALQTASTIASFDANKNVVSLPTVTYPSLAELALVKGVTGSSIQTQLNSKQASSSILSGLSLLNYTGGSPFVKMVSASVFTLDNSTYLTSVGIANLTATGTPSATTYLRGDNTWATVISGATNLTYTPSPTNGIVVSSTGDDATLPLADATNAGLLKPAKFTVLENTSGINTGDNAVNSLYSGLATSKQDTLSGTGFVKSTAGTISYDTNAYTVANTAITGATNTKITYDAKGLVTAGTSLIASDIPNIAQSQVTNLTTDLAAKAPLASPTFTGTPSLPTGTTGVTQTPLNNSTRLATTAYVEAACAVVAGASGVTVSPQDTFGTANIATVTTAQYAAFVTAGTVSATTLYFITA